MKENETPSFAGYYFSAANCDVMDPQGNPAGLRPQSADVFGYLAVNHNRVVSRRELEDKIWADTVVTDDSLSKCISEIRQTIGDDTRTVLKTFPKRGYQLRADAADIHDKAQLDSSVVPSAADESSHRQNIGYMRVGVVLVLLVVGLAISFLDSTRETEESHAPVVSLETDGFPRLLVSGSLEIAADEVSQSITAELRSALNDYRTVQQTTSDADLHLIIRHHDVSQTVVAEMVELSSGEILFAESYAAIAEEDFKTDAIANRIAASVASPGVGAVDTYLLDRSKLISPEALSPAACYAYGYGCAKCSGEEDSITRRAEACLESLLKKNPQDSRAWALQATIYAHQYWWANTLPEPLRSNPALRKHLPQKAIDAAHKAESLSKGGDTGVYWGMAEAYFSACDADKLKTAIDRGLEINPNDPNLLGAFGNWLAYSGRWEEGSAMALRALEIEPVNYRKWWWMGPAKAAYFKGDYELAYKYFLKSFSERNWMSHLQQAYTLPHIGRVDDARKSVATLQYMYPGFTREKALEIYDLLCFPDSFLKKIDEALTTAGLPSRGSSNDLSNITLPRAQVVNLNGIDIEYLDVGRGEPVVFVHGAFNDYRTWGHYMVPVSEAHRYLSYSRRYFGTQKWHDEGESFSAEVFAQDLINLIEKLGLNGVHVVSWSSGVRTAMVAGVMRPDLFKSMIHFEPVDGSVMQGIENEKHVKELADAWGINYGPIVQSALSGNKEDAVAKFYELVFEVPPGSYEQEREIHREVTRQNAHTIAVNLTRYRQDKIKLTCDYVSQVKVPTLIAVGEKTHEFWQLMSRRFADCLPNAGVEVIKDSNHYAPISKIGAFTSFVLQFVDSHR